MTLHLDPEAAAAIAALTPPDGAPAPAPVGDWQARRDSFGGLLGVLTAVLPSQPGVRTADLAATAADGTPVPVRLYRALGAGRPGALQPLAVFIHGGGMIAASIAMYDRICQRYMALSGVALLAVDYRLAPEHPHPAPVEDSYQALLLAHDNAEELGVDPGRIAVMGASAGGGIAAAVALMARDRSGPPLAAQILIYPCSTTAPAGERCSATQPGATPSAPMRRPPAPPTSAACPGLPRGRAARPLPGRGRPLRRTAQRRRGRRRAARPPRHAPRLRPPGTSFRRHRTGHERPDPPAAPAVTAEAPVRPAPCALRASGLLQRPAAGPLCRASRSWPSRRRRAAPPGPPRSRPGR